MRLALIVLIGAALYLPAYAQIPGAPVLDPNQPGSVERILAVGLVMRKSDCSIAFPDLRERLQAVFVAFARNNTKTFSESQWNELDEKASHRQSGAAPSKQDCEELLSRFATEDFDAASRDLSRELQDIREGMAAARNGRGSIGVAIDPKSSDARVKNVIANSPAEKAGIREGDTIVQFDGKPIRRAWQLFAAVRSTPPGKKVRLTVVRQEALIELEAEVAQVEGE